MSRKSSRRVKSAKQSKAKQSKVRRNKGRKVGRKSVSKRKSKSKSSKVMKGGNIGSDTINILDPYLIQKLEDAEKDTYKHTLEQKLRDINTNIADYGTQPSFSGEDSTEKLKHNNLIEQKKNAIIQKQLYDLIVNYRNFQVATVNACLEYNKLNLKSIQARIFESGFTEQKHPIYQFYSRCADNGLEKAYYCIYESEKNKNRIGSEMLIVIKKKIGELNTELEELEAEFEKLK